MNKHTSRVRRGLKTKKLIQLSDRPRLVVYRSNVHIYGQIVVPSEKGDKVIVSASTLDKTLKDSALKKTEAAYNVGKLLASKAKEANIVQVAFDRSGYKYHGRVAALANGAREAGLDF